MVDTETGEFTEKTISHEGNAVREFYAALAGPVVVGIEATGSMQWFLELLEELGIECRVGHPAKIRAKETRKQKHDRRDAGLMLDLLIENRFPEIWMPSTAERDLRTLLRDRHQWVRMRTRLQHTLQAIASSPTGVGLAARFASPALRSTASKSPESDYLFRSNIKPASVDRVLFTSLSRDTFWMTHPALDPQAPPAVPRTIAWIRWLRFFRRPEPRKTLVLHSLRGKWFSP